SGFCGASGAETTGSPVSGSVVSTRAGGAGAGVVEAAGGGCIGPASLWGASGRPRRVGRNRRIRIGGRHARPIAVDVGHVVRIAAAIVSRERARLICRVVRVPAAHARLEVTSTEQDVAAWIAQRSWVDAGHAEPWALRRARLDLEQPDLACCAARIRIERRLLPRLGNEQIHRNAGLTRGLLEMRQPL